MRRTWAWGLLVALVVTGAALGVWTEPIDAQQRNLVAKKVAAAPTVDGTLDAAWSAAPVTTVKVVGGKNLPGGSTEVAMRALYTADSIYVMYQYKDPTQSLQRSPWVKQADGSWAMLKDPDDKGGDNNKYTAGDEVPGIIVAPFVGDRGDVPTTMVWKDGVWTLVLRRKLVTGSEFDVQFDDLKKTYAFGVAVFDNAQVRHAYSPGALKLVFE